MIVITECVKSPQAEERQHWTILRVAQSELTPERGCYIVHTSRAIERNFLSPVKRFLYKPTNSFAFSST